jgi:hypothetical protein
MADTDLSSTEQDPYTAAVRVLAPITALGWLFFGMICVLSINGRGRAGRWVPEWYLDTLGTRRDRAWLVAWWVVVLVLWPVILPMVLGKRVIGWARASCGGERGAATTTQLEEGAGPGLGKRMGKGARGRGFGWWSWRGRRGAMKLGSEDSAEGKTSK